MAKSFRDRYKKAAEQAQKNYEQEHREREQESGFGSIFLKDKIPEGMGFWKCGPGQHIIDIIPWFSSADFYKGEDIYKHDLVVWVHQNVGVTNEHFVCQARMFKQKDPQCEYMSKQRLAKEEYNEVRPKQRDVYLIWCHDSPAEEAKGVQIWEVAHFFMGKKLDVISKLPKGGGFENFWDPDSGKSIVWERQGSGLENTEYIGHRFLNRDEPVPDHILKQAFPLDTIVKWNPTYEEHYEAFYGQPVDSEGEEATPLHKETAPAQTQEAASTEGAQRLKQAQEEDAPPPEEKEKPEKKQPPVKKEKPTPVKKDKSDTKCPHGYTFGEDIDQNAECSGCDVWDDCSDEADRIEAEKKEGGTRLAR